jgi:hypothetical protein
MNPPNTSLVEQRRVLASKRDKALQSLSIAYDYAEEGTGSRIDVAAAAEEAEGACRAVVDFDARHPHIRTRADAEDDAQVREFMNRMTGN